jgi:biopolymer transport protein ExbB/TolQ
MTGNSLWYLIVQSDAMSKSVLLCLLGMSILCWTVFFFKIIVHCIKVSHIKKALHELSLNNSVLELKQYASAHKGTVASYIIHKDSSIFDRLTSKGAFDVKQACDALEYGADQAVDDAVQQEFTFIPLLSTCAMVAPLLGLFGTIWGLVHAFLSIAERHNADITTVAPGIAEALITTLAGLIVAIPAQIMYNVMVSRIRMFDALATRCADIVRSVFQHSL